MQEMSIEDERIGFKKVNGAKKIRCSSKVGAVRLIDGLQLELQRWTVSPPRASGKVAVAHATVLEIIRISETGKR